MKYYTPKIEEFGVGFEYEFHGMTTGGLAIMDMQNNSMEFISEPSVEVWTKECFDKDEMGLYPRSINSIEEIINSNQLRVKYLDHDDIIELVGESLSTHKNYIVIPAPGNIGYWTEIVLDMRFGSDDLIISGRRGDEEGHLFRGEIKNKSELKRLLKQLNIIK